MKLATLLEKSRDGCLVVVSADGKWSVDASAIAPSLLDALQRWSDVEGELKALYESLNAGCVASKLVFDPRRCAAPLPRGPQWCDASAFLNHGRLMEKAFNLKPIQDLGTTPLMYQGASDDFLGAYGDVVFPDEAHGIDFEGEFGVIVDDVPMGTPPDEAIGFIRLITQLNDWSLRALGSYEMQRGFGFLQSKPSTSFAPVVVTPDELGPAWSEGRIDMSLHVTVNGERFGEPSARYMDFGFGQLLAHAARTRRLTAGTIVGSGTVSNVDRSVGSTCIAERRVIEMLDLGEPRTSFLRFGDRVQMQARWSDGREGPFGSIDQHVVCSPAAGGCPPIPAA